MWNEQNLRLNHSGGILTPVGEIMLLLKQQFRKKSWNWEVIKYDVKSFLWGQSCKTNEMFSNVPISSQQQQLSPKWTAAKTGDQITPQKAGELLCVPLNVEFY